MSRPRRAVIDVSVVLHVSDRVSVSVLCRNGHPDAQSLAQLQRLIQSWARSIEIRARKGEQSMAGEMVGLEKYGPNPDWRLLENHGYWTIQRRTAFSQVRFEPDTWTTLPDHFDTQEAAIAHIDQIIADEQMGPARPQE